MRLASLAKDASGRSAEVSHLKQYTLSEKYKYIILCLLLLLNALKMLYL